MSNIDTIKKIINGPKSTLLDVRTTEEYESGNVPNSVNIPLQELSSNLDKLKSLEQPIIAFCASGVRSAKACEFLKNIGIMDCHNGGGWRDVLKIIQENN